MVELATDNIAILPPKWTNEFLGNVAPVPAIDRFWLILALGMLGSFAEAASYEAELIQLAEPTRHATTIGLAFFAGGFLRLIKGDWARAHSLLERDVEVTRAGSVGLLLPQAVAMSAWVLAQLGDINQAVSRLQEGEQLAERAKARGLVTHQGWAYQVLGRAALLLRRPMEANRLGGHALELSPCQMGYAAYAHCLLGDAVNGSTSSIAAQAIARRLRSTSVSGRQCTVVAQSWWESEVALSPA